LNFWTWLTSILQLHPFTFKSHGVIITYGWVQLHCVSIYTYIYPGVVSLDHMSVLLFCFLRNHHIPFHNSCTNFHSYQQCILHTWQHLLFFLLLKMAIVIGVRWNLSIVLICISFIAREVKHFFMYLLATCTSSFENSLYNLCAHFFIGMLILWVQFLNSLYTLDINTF
jgi:hypothetical protein